MKAIVCIGFFLLIGFGLAVYAKESNQSKALIMNIQNNIGPAEQDYFERGIKYAAKQKYSIIILQLNSKGGLSRPIRRINDYILSSPIPIIAYVSPEYAHAFNESMTIVYASHLAVMAPNTYIGRTRSFIAPPVVSEESQKQIYQQNQLASSLLSLSRLRGRNSEWAETSIYKPNILTANGAYQHKVVDEIAANLPELLTKIDGHKTRLFGTLETLQTKNFTLVKFPKDWHYYLFRFFTDPVVIYFLLFLSLYGMLFEFTSPFNIPIFLFLIFLCLFFISFYFMHFWPVHYLGLIFMFIGLTLCFVGHSRLSSLLWKTPGILLFVFGSYVLFAKSTIKLEWQPIAASSGLIIIGMIISKLVIHKKIDRNAQHKPMQ